jgi:hypothetical protein
LNDELREAWLDAQVWVALERWHGTAAVELACRSLEAGLDNQPVRELAAMNSPTWGDVFDPHAKSPSR